MCCACMCIAQWLIRRIFWQFPVPRRSSRSGMLFITWTYVSSAWKITKTWISTPLGSRLHDYRELQTCWYNRSANNAVFFNNKSRARFEKNLTRTAVQVEQVKMMNPTENRAKLSFSIQSTKNVKNLRIRWFLLKPFLRVSSLLDKQLLDSNFIFKCDCCFFNV